MTKLKNAAQAVWDFLCLLYFIALSAVVVCPVCALFVIAVLSLLLVF